MKFMMSLEKNVFNKDPKFLAQILNAGGIIIFPTDTLYGLGCDATNPQALLKIYQIKSRQLGKSFPILVKDFKMLLEYAIFNSEQKKAIIKVRRPTTFILKAKNLSPLVMQKHTAAFRIPRIGWVKKIFKYFDKPIVATSANLSGQDPMPNPQNYQTVFAKNTELIDAVAFHGINKKRNPSAIVDLTKRPFKKLR